MKDHLGRLLTGALIFGSNITTVAFALFSVFASKAWTLAAVAILVGFVSGLVIGDIRLAFLGSLGCFITSLVLDAVLVGTFTYSYGTADGAVRQVMAELFLQKVLLAALVVFLPINLLSWIVGALLSEFLVR